MVKPIHVLSGPNLNLLGTREPEIYGKDTLDDVRARCEARAASRGVEVVFRQSNHEGVLIDWVHEAIDEGAGIIINPAAYTFTSLALFDALKMFPAEALPPAALKAWRAVLPKGTLVLAVGGMRPQTLRPYWDAGADGFGTGSNLYKPGVAVADVATAARAYRDAARALPARG